MYSYEILNNFCDNDLQVITFKINIFGTLPQKQCLHIP